MRVTDRFDIQLASSTDAAALAALRWQFKYEDHETTAPQVSSVQDAESWLRRKIDSGHWLVWIAMSGGEICGHVFLNHVERVPEPFAVNNPLGYVTNFYVTPSHRNLGIGTALLNALHQYTEEHTLNTLIVWPSDRSAPVYKRAGYKTPGELLERTG